uniref:Uncharacterized protein ORF2 n=1 Tax=Nocardioides simplex TaxID=2045 RepID=O05089_NOCSI|nr:hypothetical protein [Pimelobacter simplex]
MVAPAPRVAAPEDVARGVADRVEPLDRAAVGAQRTAELVGAEAAAVPRSLSTTLTAYRSPRSRGAQVRGSASRSGRRSSGRRRCCPGGSRRRCRRRHRVEPAQGRVNASSGRPAARASSARCRAGARSPRRTTPGGGPSAGRASRRARSCCGTTVEDQPHRADRVAGPVAAEHGLPEGHVVGRLVDEPAAVAVDHDRAGQRALGQQHLRRPAGQRGDGGEPPGLVHQRHSGAHLGGELDRVAGVALVAQAPVVEELGLVAVPHVHVVVEPAGREDDAPARGHGDPAAVALEHRADHPVALGDQLDQRGLAPDRDAGAQRAVEQPGRERLPAGQVVAADHHAADALSGAAQDARQALAGLARDQVHPLVVRTGDRHRDRCLDDARPQQRPGLAQHRRVERLALDAAPRGVAARQLRVVVGVAARPHQLERRRPPQHPDGLGAVPQERLPAGPSGRRHPPPPRGRSRRARACRASRASVSAGLAASRRRPERAVEPPTYSVFSTTRTWSPLLARAEGSGEPGARADDEQVHGGVGHDGVLSQVAALN